MRVALFCQGFPATSETFVINHVVRLLREGVDLAVLTLGEGTAWANVPEDLRDEVRARVRVVDQDMLRGRWDMTRGPLALLARMGRWMMDALHKGEPALGRYDAILCHFGPTGIAALRLRRRGHITGPIATIFHGYEMSVHKTVAALLPHYRRLFRETEALLPISAFWAEKLAGWGAEPAKIRVLHMGTDVPDAVPVRSGGVGHPLKILAVGRLTEKKGTRYAIEGVKMSTAAARLDIIGSGPLESDLQAMAATLTGPNTIRFLGALPHREVLAALDDADIFLLPSVTAENGDMEGIPVAIMEAMLHGCLVISTQHSGIPELVHDSQSGILLPERSSKAIATALEAVSAGDHDVDAMRREAIATVRRSFNNEQLIHELLEILHSLADGRPPAG